MAVNPKRGEVWNVRFDPTEGAEIQKTRPAVVVSSDAVRPLPIKLIAPITGWDERFANRVWLVRIDPDAANGLTKPSAVDVLQLHGWDEKRFLDRRGRVSAVVMDEIAAAIAALVEYSG